MIRLSHSARKTLGACPRKFMLMRQFRKPWKPGQAAEVGKGFHKLVELAYTLPSLAALDEEFARWSTGVRSDLASVLDIQERETLYQWHYKGKALAREYLEHPPSPHIGDVLSAEHRGMLNLGEDLSIPVVIDQLATLRGEVVIVDFKTTSLDVELYAQQLVKSHQATTYLLWAQGPEFKALFGDRVPTSVVFDIVATPQIRQKVRENWGEYIERYAEAAVPAVRRVFTPTEADFENTRRAFANDKRELEYYIESGYWPQRESCIGTDKTMCGWTCECDQVTAGTLSKPSAELFHIKPVEK